VPRFQPALTTELIPAKDRGENGIELTPEQYQKKTNDKVNEVLTLLSGLTIAQSTTILEATISQLPYRSCVQSHLLIQ
jgi:hypothetical protein